MTWCVSRRLGPISAILTIHNTPILKFNLRASYKYRSKSYDQEKQLAKNCVTFSNFSPQEVNRFSQLCASLQLPLCFELHATHATIFQNLRKTTVVVAAFSKTESLYRRISTKYKSSKLIWRVLEDNKQKKTQKSRWENSKNLHVLSLSRLILQHMFWQRNKINLYKIPSRSIFSSCTFFA